MKQLYINGAWLDGASSSANINPSNTADIIDHYAVADARQTDLAIAAAAAAAPGWALSNIQMRHDALDKIGSEILARRKTPTSRPACAAPVQASSYGSRKQGGYAAEFFTIVKTAYCGV